MKSSELPDYRRVMWKVPELALAIGKSIGAVVVLTFCFYRSFWALLPMSIVGLWFFRGLGRVQVRKTQRELELQFRECIRSVSASLRAGYAVENAFGESEEDMVLLYGKDSHIYRELLLIRRGLTMNIPLERLLMNLADRSGSDAILQFAEVFAIAKRGGGNLTEIISQSIGLIGQQIDMRQEIQTILSGRRMEQGIMKVVPFGILLYIGITNPGYFDDLYGNLTGVSVMTVLLIIYLVAYGMGDRILERLEES
jgi:tight adherence protein B